MSPRKIALIAIIVVPMPLACWKSGLTPGGGLSAGSLDKSGDCPEAIVEPGGWSQWP